MAMDGCGNCLKYTFGFVNLVIFLGGGVLLGVGITALAGDVSQLNQLLDTNLYTGVAIVITVAGALIVLISFLGCCGAFQESKCLLSTFFCLVLLLFVVVAAVAIAGFVMGRSTLINKISNELSKSISKYNEEQAIKESWDFLQQNFQCCGAEGPTDWSSELGPTIVPQSCCKPNSDGEPGVCTAILNSYPTGCVQKMRNFIENNSSLFGGIAIAVAVLLLLSMIVSCAIIKSIF